MPRATVIFVFGSNLKGVHGAYAARDAVAYYGAKHGQAEGLQGRAYAIPTCDASYRALPLAMVIEHVTRFLEFAERYSQLTFLVTRVGCGSAGYTDYVIAPLFRTAPDNCCLPVEWTPYLEDALHA